MRKIKTACIYCGLETEMEVKDRYFAADGSGALYEIECPRCHRLFGRQEKNVEEGGFQNGGQSEGTGKT